MILGMLQRRWIAAALCCFTFVSCGGSDSVPAAPTGGSGGSGGDTQVSGRERLGWTQGAASAAEVSTFQFAIYVDDNRSVLAGATCGTTAGSAGFDCSAPLPPLAPGAHKIELAAFIDSGGVAIESERSSPLSITVRGLTLLDGRQLDPRVRLAEQIQLNLRLVAEGLSLPSDVAFAPDGTVFVAERGGAIRVIAGGALLPDRAIDLSGEVWLPEGGLLAIAVDPKFQDTQFVYTLTAAKARGGGLGFVLSRYRSVDHRLGERAVLLDRIPASPRGAGGALRFGPDGKMYLAVDDAANARTAGSLGSYNGKVLRLNRDATTPDDQAGFSPVFSLDHPLPRAIDWQPSSGELWVVDALDQMSGRLTAVAADDAKQKRGEVRTRYSLPAGTGAVSATFYRGNLIPVFRDNLFLAAEAGQSVVRLQFDPKNPERVMSAERLMQDQIGPVRVVAVGPDESLYVANDSALFRLVP
jgi:glucose/arabinose dehydrogenase